MRRVCIRSREKKKFKIYTGKPKDKPNPLLLATLPDPRFALLTSLVPERNSGAKDWAVMTPWGAREQNRNPEP